MQANSIFKWYLTAVSALLIPAVVISGVVQRLEPYDSAQKGPSEMITWFTEDFDGILPPELPFNWMSSGEGWSTSASVASNGSGLNNLVHEGLAAGRVITAPVDLTGIGSAHLTYLARRSSTYPVENLKVTASMDGGLSFPVLVVPTGNGLPVATSSYQLIDIEIPEALLGRSGILFRFEAAGALSSQGSLRIDDVIVQVSSLQVIPASLSFVSIPGSTQQKNIVLKNVGTNELFVAVPVVSGSAFTIQPPVEQTIQAGAETVYQVTFNPMDQNFYEGTISFAESGGSTITVSLSGITPGINQFGFKEQAGTAYESSEQVEIPFTLITTYPEGVQGLQCSVSWDNAVLELAGIGRGASISNPGSWAIDYEVSGTTAEIVLIGLNTTGLQTGVYNPLFSLKFRTQSIIPLDTLDLHLAISNLLASRATPGGEEAALAIIEPAYLLQIVEKPGNLMSSTTSIDQGLVPVNTIGRDTLFVRNESGTRPLTISEVSSTNPMIVVSPTSALVQPGVPIEFQVEFAPTFDKFGLHEGIIRFVHNGINGPILDIPIKSIGVGGRGDASSDGGVDVLDIVLTIDAILKRIVFSATQILSSDQYPYPGGDQSIDIRDLTVMAQAISRAQWPDLLGLPPDLDASAMFAFNKVQGTGALSDIKVKIMSDAGNLILDLISSVEIRALQIGLNIENYSAGPVTVVTEDIPEASSMSNLKNGTGEFRFLTFRTDGGIFPRGSYTLVKIPGASGVNLNYAVAVDQDRRRVPVLVEIADPDDTTEVIEPKVKLAIGPPFPNPYPADATTVLNIPFSTPEPGPVYIEVVDLRGRSFLVLNETSYPSGQHLLTWDGKDNSGMPLASGIYLLRITAGARSQTSSLVLIR